MRKRQLAAILAAITLGVVGLGVSAGDDWTPPQAGNVGGLLGGGGGTAEH